MKAPRFRSRQWNRRLARQFGLGATVMGSHPAVFFLATTVSGSLGLIASIAWLMVW